MIKKTLTYVNFKGEKVTKDFYFHYSKKDLMEMDNTEIGKFISSFRGVKTDNELMEMIKEKPDQVNRFLHLFISGAYGIVSNDGETFSKSKELSDNFIKSAAYDALFSEIIKNPNSIQTFIAGMFPNDTNEILKMAKENGYDVDGDSIAIFDKNDENEIDKLKKEHDEIVNRMKEMGINA